VCGSEYIAKDNLACEDLEWRAVTVTAMQVRILRASFRYKFGSEGADKTRPLSEQFGANYHCFPMGLKTGKSPTVDGLPPEFLFFRGDFMLHLHYC